MILQVKQPWNLKWQARESKKKEIFQPYPNLHHLWLKEDLLHYLQMKTKHHRVIKRSKFLNSLSS